MKWCQTQGVDPFPLREFVTWNYCSFLFETCAPATRADSFVRAARATIELLSMPCGHYETNSVRIKGVILQCIDTKRELKQAEPLSVAAVEILEDAIFNKDYPIAKRIIAGFVRFCVGARLRHSDATRITTEPKMDDARPAHSDPDTDEDEHDTSMFGFIESKGDVTKTNYTLGKRRRAIPMVAQSWGIQRSNWARVWLRLRKKDGRDASIDDTLMPACGPDWQLVPGTSMTSDTLSLIVRDILQQGGLNPDEARAFTSHSMKTTLLSWCGKAGVPKEFRTTMVTTPQTGTRSPFSTLARPF